MVRRFCKLLQCVKVVCKHFFLSCCAPREAWRFLRTIGDVILKFDSGQGRSGTSEFKRSIKCIRLPELLPDIEAQPIRIIARTGHDDGEMLLHELVVLCAICSHIQPLKVFEFGTFKGNSTLHLALNSPDKCEVFTLDLPPNARECARYPLEIGPIAGVPFTVGEKYRGSSVEHKIRQLSGDSATYDYNQFYGCTDLVFVDGSHQYDNVRSDSENALRMLRSRGVVIWHDYTDLLEHAGIIQYVNELASKMELFKVAGTSFVIAWKGGKRG